MPTELADESPSVLRFDSVTLGYGDFTVLRDITIDVSRASVVAIMGGSGSGKTTLLRAATGQIRPLGGHVSVFGQDIGRASAREIELLRKRMGVLFQQGALFIKSPFQFHLQPRKRNKPFQTRA